MEEERGGARTGVVVGAEVGVGVGDEGGGRWLRSVIRVEAARPIRTYRVRGRGSRAYTDVQR